MGVAAGMATGLLNRVTDDLSDPALPSFRLIKSRTGKDSGCKKMLKFGIGIVVTTVDVPRLRVCANLQHHGKLGPFSTTRQMALHGKHGS